MTVLDEKLKTSKELRIFLSGGGLRVARMDPFYGEGPVLSEALRILSDDIRNGKPRGYSQVYGPIETHYFTGSSAAESDSDKMVLFGRTIIVKYENGVFVSKTAIVRDFDVPDDIHQQVLKGRTVIWNDSRGLTFRSFPSGNGTTSELSSKNGKQVDNVWFWTEILTGEGQNIEEAIKNMVAGDVK